MSHGTGIKPSHSPCSICSNAFKLHFMNSVNSPRPGFPRHKKSSSRGIMMTIVLVLALAAGGVAYHRVFVQRKAAAELAARKEAEAKAARVRKAAELEAARKKAEERRAPRRRKKPVLRRNAWQLRKPPENGRKRSRRWWSLPLRRRRKSPWSRRRIRGWRFLRSLFFWSVLRPITPPTGSCLRMPSIWLSKRAVMICTPISCAPIWNGMP